MDSNTRSLLRSLILWGLNHISKNSKILIRCGHSRPEFEVVDLKELAYIERNFFYKEYTTVEAVLRNPLAGRELMYYLLCLE